MSLIDATVHGGTDEHDTPISFFEPIARAVDGFDLDPCASQTSDLADVNLTKDEGGLRQWHGKVWMNPPYSDVETWMRHAELQEQYGHTDLIVGLVFARTGTQWFHKHAANADLVCFVKGRLTFGGADNTAPAPSMVVVWGDYTERLELTLDKCGMIIKPEQ